MPLFALGERAPSLPGSADCWIAENATLVGRVRLAHDVSIWFGAVLRADEETITVGIGSNVQDNAVLHADPDLPIAIGSFCTIGHNATVHGCSVGDNSLIGMGATILNAARIGSHCLIAANALVSEGVVIPDHSIVRGVPGKIVGTADDARACAIRSAADTYIARWRRYRTAMTQIER